MKKCKMCINKFNGRSDKQFCSIACKSKYHRKLRLVTNKVTQNIDKILHRNRSILLEIIGKTRKTITVNRILLENKKFNFTYHTHSHINKHNKIYYYLYDLAWMEFSNDEILIIKSKKVL